MPLNRWTLFLYLNNFLRLPKVAIAAGWGKTYTNLTKQQYKPQGIDKEEMKELKELNMIVWSNEDCRDNLAKDVQSH